MIRDVNIIKHLPPFLQKYKELESITAAENPELQKLMDESERVKDNTFILSADEDGIARFEKILNIYVAKDEDLESRRLRVISRWNDIAPYTINALKSKLHSLHNSDNFIINRKFDKHIIEIITHLELPGQVEELDRTLDFIMPANLIVDSKNRLECHAKGESFTAVGMAHASIVELTDQYDLNLEINGRTGIGAGHSTGTLFISDDVQVFTTEG